MFFSLLFPLYNQTDLIDLNYIAFRPEFVSASSDVTSILRANYSKNPIIYFNTGWMRNEIKWELVTLSFEITRMNTWPKTMRNNLFLLLDLNL
jgi:hypothetical protein